jgi:leucyl-tRNA synthetase
MDTFVDSSWYFLRYCDAMQDETCFDSQVANHWMNVDFYCGGIEHAQMHLIYARFWTKALRDLDLHSCNEPFQELLCQGMVNKSAPWCDSCAITLNVSHSGENCPHCDNVLTERSAKMSKSLGNTVSPEEMIDRYGSDTVRLFILFAANPTAGMDWSDTALEANHRQMIQLYNMPDSILSWNGGESQIDSWLLARIKLRTQKWKESMESYDLRGAVEISHFDIIKDVNWYRRREGNNPIIGRIVLETWAHMISIASPHLAEDWWKILGNNDLIAGKVFNIDNSLTEEDENSLVSEAYLKAFLEIARKVSKIAEKHIGGKATSAMIHISRPWKRRLAQNAIEYLNSGGNVKAFKDQIEFTDSETEMRGEIIGFWNKRMLPQIFKWSDEEKMMIVGKLDESKVLNDASEFIMTELGLTSVEIEAGETDVGRSSAAMPLAPTIVYK